MTQPLVTHISDTARRVAVYRAWETNRPDALFSDPFAERLAGEQGRSIVAAMPRQARSGWPLIMRTKLIDNLVLQLVGDGADPPRALRFSRTWVGASRALTRSCAPPRAPVACPGTFARS